MTATINENTLEIAALGWFEALGCEVRKGADISPGGDEPLRQDYGQVVLEPRLRAALREINAHLPADAIEHAVRVVTRPPEPTLAQNNRWFHRLLTDGIDVEYRTKGGGRARRHLKIPMVVADEGVRCAFSASIRPLFEHKEANDRASWVLAELRDTLLPKLISGELRVSQAEKILEERIG